MKYTVIVFDESSEIFDNPEYSGMDFSFSGIEQTMKFVEEMIVQQGKTVIVTKGE